MPLWLTAAGAVCILVVARCAARQKHALAAVLGGALCGVGAAFAADAVTRRPANRRSMQKNTYR